MRKRTKVLFIIGIISLISSVVMMGFQIGPGIIPVMLFSYGCIVVFGIRGLDLIHDEMEKSVVVFSAYYSWIATFFCINILIIIIHFFYPSLLISWILLIIMMFMSLSFLLFRSYLMKRGMTK
jgi:hypothetical protein